MRAETQGTRVLGLQRRCQVIRRAPDRGRGVVQFMRQTSRELAERGQLLALAEQNFGTLDPGAHQRQYLAGNRRQLGDEVAKRLAAEYEEASPPRRTSGTDVRKVDQETDVAGEAAGWHEIDLRLAPVD